MMTSSIGAGNYYTGQTSALWRRSASAETSGQARQSAMPGNRPDPADVFSKTDSDGNGGLDATEFQTLADKIGEMTGDTLDVEEIFATYDQDGDGVLSEDETQAAMEANRPEGPPPPPEGMASLATGTSSGVSSGIESYLKMAALGQEQETNLFALPGGNNGATAAASLFSVNTLA